MDYIYKEQVLNICIDVYKGQSAIKEDFSRADLKVFLVCGVEKLRIPLSVTLDSTGTLKGSVSNLPIGIYGIKLMWNKNHGRSPMIAEKYQLFGITEYSDEATNPTADSATIKTVLRSATYGYDGLDAYELSVLRGKTTLSEEEWLEKINSGGGSGETKVTYSEWELSFNLAKSVADPDGELIKVESASISRVKTTKKDGAIISQVPETRDASLEIINGTKQVVEGVTYIKVTANESESSRTILVKAYDDDLKLSKTISITQEPATSIYIINAKEADGYECDFTSRDIIIDDNPVTIYFKKYGDIGTPIVSGAPDWLNVSSFTINDNEIKLTVTPTANTSTTQNRTASLSVTINRTKVVRIGVTQSYIISENSVLTAELSYGKIPSSGGSVEATKSAKVTTTYKRSSTREYTIVNSNPTVEYSFEDNKGLVNSETGKITYQGSNSSVREEPITLVTMTAEVEGINPVQKNVQVYQSGAKLYAYYGSGSAVPTTADVTNSIELGENGATKNVDFSNARILWVALPTGYSAIMKETKLGGTYNLTTGSQASFNGVNCTIYYKDLSVKSSPNVNIIITK